MAKKKSVSKKPGTKKEKSHEQIIEDDMQLAQRDVQYKQAWELGKSIKCAKDESDQQ